MAFREELVARLTRAAPNFLRYIFIFQAFAGLLLVGLAYFMERRISISSAQESGRPGKSSATNSNTSRAHPEASLPLPLVICPLWNSERGIASSNFKIGWEPKSREPQMFR